LGIFKKGDFSTINENETLRKQFVVWVLGNLSVWKTCLAPGVIPKLKGIKIEAGTSISRIKGRVGYLLKRTSASANRD